MESEPVSPPSTSAHRQPRQSRNRIRGVVCAVVFVAMVGASFAAVPFYKAFCQATGFEGTVRRANVAPDKVLAKTLMIHFDTNVHDLPWDFSPEQNSQKIKIGDTNLALFKVTNHSDHPITGRAVFNVVPEQAGAYFEKLSCFCFSDETIPANRTVEMPVLYFVDPKYADDFETRESKDITLSYTFYPATDVPANGKFTRSTSE